MKLTHRPTFSFDLRFPEVDIKKWAGRYEDPPEYETETVIVPRAKKRGCLKYDEFIAICHWKTARTASRCASNPPKLVVEVTRTALAARHENLKLGALMILAGVAEPTASVILHFCDKGRYPILDYRALWSLGYSKPPLYTFQFWSAYCDFTRRLADKVGVSMRVLDRALWQYSKENQG